MKVGLCFTYPIRVSPIIPDSQICGECIRKLNQELWSGLKKCFVKVVDVGFASNLIDKELIILAVHIDETELDK